MRKLDKNIKRKYSITEYSPDWPNDFSVIKDFLAKIFGSKAYIIEHVGSTSVQGMCAKPVIDVLVIVKQMEDFDQQKEAMVAAGYEWGENYIAPGTLIFYKLGVDGEKIENIHICEDTEPKTRQFMVMRDYLRTHPERVIEYSRVKKENSNRFPDNYPAYREAKAPFLEKLEKEAYQWDDQGRN